MPHRLRPPTPRSYCRLKTTFSVYVYGAFPLSIFPPEITIVLLTAATLLSVWLAYMIPQLLHIEQGLEVNGFLSGVLG